MLVYELVDNLRGKVYPNVQNSTFISAFKRLNQVFFYIGYDGMSPAEIELVPFSIGLAIVHSLLA
jgi:hypothetical protein